MNKYEEVKSILSNKEVVQRYIGLPVKSNNLGNWYKSPFRSERTASFCVSEKGIHDFGSSKHYDIISFVQHYYNITAKQALDVICRDFNIDMQNDYETEKVIAMLKRKREEEREAKELVNEWYMREYQRICDEIRINKKCLAIFEKQSNYEVLQALYDEQVKLECYFEILIYADEKTKVNLYLEEKNDRRRSRKSFE